MKSGSKWEKTGHMERALKEQEIDQMLIWALWIYPRVHMLHVWYYSQGRWLNSAFVWHIKSWTRRRSGIPCKCYAYTDLLIRLDTQRCSRHWRRAQQYKRSRLQGTVKRETVSFLLTSSLILHAERWEWKKCKGRFYKRSMLYFPKWSVNWRFYISLSFLRI